MERLVPPSGGAPKRPVVKPPVNTESEVVAPETTPEVTSPEGTAEVTSSEFVGRETVPPDATVVETVPVIAPLVAPREVPSESAVFTRHDERAPEERRRASPVQKRILAFTWIGVFSMGLYALSMVLALFAPGYTLADRLASILLLLGIGFIMLHGLGYANSMIKASWGYDETRRRVFTPQTAPVVDCLVTTFNEPREVVEETLAALANLDYANKRVILLDDSTREESRLAMREAAAAFGATIVQRTNRRGYKAGAINDYLKTSDAPFVAIFDADALPAHNFLRDVVPMIEENPKLAFVQTPQHYANTDVSSVAMAASRQQSVFYEYIMEGKSYSRAAFCCGTNVVFRTEALKDVDGFDEGSVTEDFVTSLKLHAKGYDSTYYNQIYVYSMAPETLPAFFTQQSRWAFGTTGAGWAVLPKLFKLRPGQWWEYFLSSTYYWIGWVNFFFLLLPMLYIFFGVKPLRQDVFTYLAIFIPYLMFTMNMFYQGMEERGYKVGDMIRGQQLGFITFPVQMWASISGLLRLKRPFGVTPKGKGGGASWLSLWFQLLMLLLSAVAAVWGFYRYFVGSDRNTSAIVINALWALYHVFLLSGIFRLNRPVRDANRSRYFNDQGEVVDGVDITREGVTANNRTTVPSPGTVAAGTVTTGTVPPGTTVATAVGPRAVPPRANAPIFATSRGDGTVIAPPSARSHRAPVGRGARVALIIMLLSLVMIFAAGWSVVSWYLAPTIPTNVYVLDRTTGRDYQEHRALIWTLNYLKVRKEPNFGPNGAAGNSSYNYANDFYGFVPGDPNTATPDETNQGDLVVGGRNVPLPDKLETPGVLMLADTYGEFVEYDYRQEKYIRYRSEIRGIKPDEVDSIVDFSGRGGLVVGEWNTIGYPTLPTTYEDVESWQQGIKTARAGLKYVQEVELPRRLKDLEVSQQSTDQNLLKTLRENIKLSQDSIAKSKADIAELQRKLVAAGETADQIAAQRRLQEVLHVNYLGWYGRYVDKFEEEREYDFRLWKNVKDDLVRRGNNNDPKGPGFVFYRDGPSTIINPETGKEEENPFARPVILTQDDLADTNTTQLATINRNDEQFKDDPLLKNVDAQVPCRYWFDVVSAKTGGDMMTYYKLLVKPSGITKLREANFPANYLLDKDKDKGNERIIFPASVAYRPNGKLQSFYFAGDAADYSLVPRIAEMIPAVGGINYFMAHRTGPFPAQYYWNYYQPLLRNVMQSNSDVRYGAAK